MLYRKEVFSNRSHCEASELSKANSLFSPTGETPHETRIPSHRFGDPGLSGSRRSADGLVRTDDGPEREMRRIRPCTCQDFDPLQHMWQQTTWRSKPRGARGQRLRSSTDVRVAVFSRKSSAQGQSTFLCSACSGWLVLKRKMTGIGSEWLQTATVYKGTRTPSSIDEYTHIYIYIHICR